MMTLPLPQSAEAVICTRDLSQSREMERHRHGSRRGLESSDAVVAQQLIAHRLRPVDYFEFSSWPASQL